MIKSNHIRSVAVGFAAAMCLTGCGQKEGTLAGAAPAQTAVQASSLEETSGAAGAVESPSEAFKPDLEKEAQSAERPDSGEDRYQEMIDRSADEGKLVFYFLDLEVGPDAKDKSGDSTIIISPDGKVMLLDAGHPDAADIVVGVLKDLGVEKIDCLVASHPHIDHIGGVPEVMSRFPVEKAYESCVEYTTQTYYDYVNALKESGTEVVSLKTGDEFDFGEQVHVEVLGPGSDIQYPDGFPENSTQFLNNNSLLLKFTYGETTALFGGDLYVSQERDYLDQYGDLLHVDIAKVNHHGKDTSNLKKWIKTVSPKIAVAMGDEMGSMDVYNNYVKEGTEYHHTVNDGMVKVAADDKGNCEAADQKDSWMN